MGLGGWTECFQIAIPGAKPLCCSPTRLLQSVHKSVFRALPSVTFALALFFTLFFAKAWVSEHYGSDLPNWDQWDAEGTHLLLPWSKGELKFFDLFTPHNEHRVALAKALSLALVSVNGQWDARIQMLINSAMHSLLAVGLWFWLKPMLTRRWHLILWALALVATFAPPHAWQNNLGGFHSLQYFLLGLSLIGIDRCLRCRPPSVGWFLGVFCLGLVLFSMASGPAAAGIVFLALLALHGSPWRAAHFHGITLLVSLAIIVAGIALRVEFSPHESLRAHSSADFGWTLWRAVQWPVTTFTAFGAVAYLPWLILALRVTFARDHRALDPRERVIVAAGGWVVVQFLAAAYARGAGGTWPASRYFDTHTAGLLVNLGAFLILLIRQPMPAWLRWTGHAALAAWCLAIGHGLYQHAVCVTRDELPQVAGWFQRSTVNTRLYLGTDDLSWLKEGEVPYPSVEALVERLSHPELRTLMPVSVRAALPLYQDSTDGFSPEAASPSTPKLVVAPTWGSFDAVQGVAATGIWRSRSLQPPDFGYLKIETAGDLRRGRVSLEVWSDDLTRRLGRIEPGRTPGDQWRAGYIRMPKEAFRLVAKDEDTGAWLAFGAPVPMAAGSYWCWRLAAHALLLTGISAGFWLIALPFATRPDEDVAASTLH